MVGLIEHRGIALELVRGLGRDHVDGAGDRILAEQNTLGPPQDLDALQVE